jgi:hypothetical protein
MAALLASCGNKADEFSFESAKAERQVAIDDSKGAPTCKVNLQVLYAKGQSEAAKKLNAEVAHWLLSMEQLGMQQAVDSMANDYVDTYRRDMAPLYREDAGDPEKKRWYDYHYNIKTTIGEGDDDVIVYVADIDYYEGGAHGIGLRLVANFDKKTGERLPAFWENAPHVSKKLSQLLTEALMDKVDADNLDELHEKGYLYDTDALMPSENFIWGSDDVTFIYNVYEIAPYGAGRIEVKVDRSDVEKLMKE